MKSPLRHICKILPALLLLALIAAPVAAQNFNGDARLIAIGGVGDKVNDASKLAGPARSYRSIGLPLGLIQLYKNRDILNPDNDEFDPAQAVGYAIDPLHLTFDRKGSPASVLFMTNLVNGEFNRNLAAYSGFAPKQKISGNGLLSPTFGKTVNVYKNGANRSQGVYVGAGPYVSIGTELDFSQALIDLWASGAASAPANTTYQFNNFTESQFVAAITGGYRARMPVPGHTARRGANRDGLYLSANYNYLYGIHYESADSIITLQTDSGGLLTVTPNNAVLINREQSARGRGFALDVASSVVVNNWEVSFGADGIVNHIDWDRRKGEQVVMGTLINGQSFNRLAPAVAPVGIRRVQLPIRMLASTGYNTERWSAMVEFSLKGKGKSIIAGVETPSAGADESKEEFHGGAEYRLVKHLEFRGGARYSNDKFHPSGGVGINLTKSFGIDFALFTTAPNIERVRKFATAFSLRIGG